MKTHSVGSELFDVDGQIDRETDRQTDRERETDRHI